MVFKDRVLIVDDELDICLMVTNHLKRMRYKAEYALTVKDARSKMGKSVYQYVFLDLKLTDGSGFDVITYMHALNLTSKIIVISAHSNEAGKAMAMGASLFVNKPFTSKTLDAALATLNLLPN